MLNKTKNAQTAAPLNAELLAASNAKSMLSSLRSSNNPKEAAMAMANTNPTVKSAMDYVNQNGGDPRTAALKYMAANGIDANSLLNLLGGK